MACLVKQGAEARVYLISFPGVGKAIVKERFKKAYRHPLLDEKLTNRRVLQEARCLVKLKKAGLATPTLYLVDVPLGIIYMEYVSGTTVREYIGSEHYKNNVGEIAKKIGEGIAVMHDLDIVHGDLTTSNMILRESGKLSLIDFGLSYTSNLAEDKAVDLYVLERALSSTHPDTEHL
ncbi:TP53 regulating kinase, partial [Nowakowskiella sp. JEL0078]